MKIEPATATSISLLFLLLFTQSPFVSGAGEWYYWIKPGAYAKCAYLSKNPLGFHNVFYLTDGSEHPFRNFTFVWQVTAVSGLYATVDYNLTFHTSSANMVFYKTLTVRLDTLELVENGTAWGRWPYWIHGWEVGADWEVAPNITMIHDYLPSPLHPGVSNTTVNVTVLFYQLPLIEPVKVDTEVYNFSKERTIVTGTRPLRWEVAEEYAAGYYATVLDSFYDSVSLVFLSMFSGYFTDDVLYHGLGVWEAAYSNGELLLVDSNIDFEPSETPDETSTTSPWLVAGVAIALALPVVGAFLKLKMRRRR